jgi:hypothetical protein
MSLNGKRENKKTSGKTTDKFEPFRGKTSLTEGEVNLMKTRLNRGDISRNQMPDDGYNLTASQCDKGVAWLRKRHTKLGYRELKALGVSTDKSGDIVRNSRGSPEWHTMDNTRMTLIDWYPQYNPYTGKVIFHYPVYEVSGHDSSFQYYIMGGEIHLVG